MQKTKQKRKQKKKFSQNKVLSKTLNKKFRQKNSFNPPKNKNWAKKRNEPNSWRKKLQSQIDHWRSLCHIWRSYMYAAD